jgi:soluble lytic murein transglycosylase-like protein
MIPEWVFQLPMNIIKAKAEDADIDPRLLASICWQESRGFVYAVRFEPNYKWTYRIEKFAKMQRITVETEEKLQMQSYGLSQIMGGTARWLGFSGPLPALYKPETNLFWATKYIKYLSQKYTKTDDIIAAYNAGSVVKSPRGVYTNQKYVDSVTTNLKQLRNVK